MSEAILSEQDYPQAPAKPVAGSLEARVAERRKQLEQRTTELFDVPGFEDVFQVELQMVGWKRLRQIAAQHERVHEESQKELRTAADQLLAATVGFHAIVDEDGNTQSAEGVSWKGLAQAYDSKLDETTRGRVALLRLLGETQTVFLWNDWQTWMKTGSGKVERELEKDF